MSVRYPGYLDGQGGSDLTALLEAFAYDPYVRTYDEDKGSTLVFVENFSTLHVSADGSVIFNTSALEGGLEAYIAGEVEQDEVLRLQTDFAYTLLREVQGSMSDSSQAMLFDVEERDDNVCVLSFIQLVGGIPVEAGTPFAWFEFQGNKMIEAQFHLRTLEPTGVRTPVLPASRPQLPHRPAACAHRWFTGRTARECLPRSDAIRNKPKGGVRACSGAA